MTFIRKIWINFGLITSSGIKTDFYSSDGSLWYKSNQAWLLCTHLLDFSTCHHFCNWVELRFQQNYSRLAYL